MSCIFTVQGVYSCGINRTTSETIEPLQRYNGSRLTGHERFEPPDASFIKTSKASIQVWDNVYDTRDADIRTYEAAAKSSTDQRLAAQANTKRVLRTTDSDADIRVRSVIPS